MTLEELQAKVEALESEKESITAKNKELLSEVKKERNKAREIDADSYYKALDELDNLKAENSKLNGALKLKDKDIEKLSVSYQEANGKLVSLSKKDEINKIVESGGFTDEWKSHAREHLELKSSLTDGVLMFGDKNAEDFLKDWTAPTGTGHKFLLGKQHSGGGATGGNGNPAPTTKKRSEMTDSEKAAYITEHGQDAYFKL